MFDNKGKLSTEEEWFLAREQRLRQGSGPFKLESVDSIVNGCPDILKAENHNVLFPRFSSEAKEVGL
jgi:hypothetical protein